MGTFLHKIFMMTQPIELLTTQSHGLLSMCIICTASALSINAGPAELGCRWGKCPLPIILGLLIETFDHPPNNLGFFYAAAPPKILTLH